MICDTCCQPIGDDELRYTIADSDDGTTGRHARCRKSTEDFHREGEDIARRARDMFDKLSRPSGLYKGGRRE